MSETNHSTKKPLRLGDILIRQKKIAPHQLGVALSVQQKAHLPIGEILVETAVISRFQLLRALVVQKIAHLFSGRTTKQVTLYGIELASLGHDLLQRHLKRAAEKPENMSPEQQQALKLRAERAHLTCTARIVEDDDALKKRLMTGNF